MSNLKLDFDFGDETNGAKYATILQRRGDYAGHEDIFFLLLSDVTRSIKPYVRLMLFALLQKIQNVKACRRQCCYYRVGIIWQILLCD